MITRVVLESSRSTIVENPDVSIPAPTASEEVHYVSKPNNAENPAQAEAVEQTEGGQDRGTSTPELTAGFLKPMPDSATLTALTASTFKIWSDIDPNLSIIPDISMVAADPVSGSMASPSSYDMQSWPGLVDTDHPLSSKHTGEPVNEVISPTILNHSVGGNIINAVEPEETTTLISPPLESDRPVSTSGLWIAGQTGSLSSTQMMWNTVTSFRQGLSSKSRATVAGDPSTGLGKIAAQANKDEITRPTEAPDVVKEHIVESGTSRALPSDANPSTRETLTTGTQSSTSDGITATDQRLQTNSISDSLVRQTSSGHDDPAVSSGLATGAGKISSTGVPSALDDVSESHTVLAKSVEVTAGAIAGAACVFVSIFAMARRLQRRQGTITIGYDTSKNSRPNLSYFPLDS